ncbi:MAG TPA: arginine--tRNA ligase [Woeseiaceae bacterium]|nr:arginine--tRNA ligase [Woeseiaceae bacterium]
MKKIIINSLQLGTSKLPKLKKNITNDIISDSVERTRDHKHGDFTSNIAMRLAKSLKTNPKDLARKIVENLSKEKLIQKIEIAGPGFINFYLSDKAFHKELKNIISNIQLFSSNKKTNKTKILLEFVSANPTGPLHVGHGRHAAFGATLGNILEATGHDITREYYVNDDGRQMDILCISTIIRLLQQQNFKIKMPTAGYQGEYIKTIASSIDEKIKISQQDLKNGIRSKDGNQNKEKFIDELIELAKKTLGIEKFNHIRDKSLTSIKLDIKEDLEQFGVRFDSWFSEQDLTKNGSIDKALSKLKKEKLLYKKDGAIWFKATKFGDEKDRVVIRENQNKTYFTSDIVYHHNKKIRGYNHLIDILGSDHHGYIARVKAGLNAMDHDPNDLEVELVQFVSLYRDGEKQAMSTRSGEFVTLRQLREEVGNDAARFFYVLRSNEQHLDFDLELAKSKTNENPVYYIQYAHARISSVFHQLAEKSFHYNEKNGIKNLHLLSTNKERELMTTLSKFPEILLLASKNRAPHNLAQFLRELANEFHSYYNESVFIVNDQDLRDARMTLIKATQIVVSTGLKIIGVSSPTSM